MDRGATPQQADVGAAIAEAESGGRTNAQGDVSFGQGGGQYVGSLGPWQIFGQAHPSVSASCAQDPACAADQVKLISSNFTDWNPWTTFKTGAYRQFLSSPADFVTGGGGSGGADVTSPTRTLAQTNPVKLPDWLSALGFSDVGDLTLRAAVLVLGTIFLIVGIITLFRAGPIVKTVAVRGALSAAGL